MGNHKIQDERDDYVSGFMIAGLASLVFVIVMAILLFETENETSQTFYWIGIIAGAMIMLLCYVGYNKDGTIKRALCDNFDRGLVDIDRQANATRRALRNQYDVAQARQMMGSAAEFAPVSSAGNQGFRA